MTPTGHTRAALARRWPELAGPIPPPRAVLQGWLDQADAGFSTIVARAGLDGYEDHVARGEIPTRTASWHDTFNVLAFAWFPRAKAALHGRMLRLRRAREQSARRSSEEDALTLLDEGVLLVAGSVDAVADFAEARRAGDLAAMDRVVHRQRDRHALGIWCFGHALLEHLILERRSIGAGVLELVVERPVRARVDEQLARTIEVGRFARPCFSPTVPWPDSPADDWVARSFS